MNRNYKAWLVLQYLNPDYLGAVAKAYAQSDAPPIFKFSICVQKALGKIAEAKHPKQKPKQNTANLRSFKI